MLGAMGDRSPHGFGERGLTRNATRCLLVCFAAIALMCAPVPASAVAAFDLLGDWGGPGAGEGMFGGQIGGIASDAKGDVYVVDTGGVSGARIEEFGAKGEFITQWGKTGSGAGEMHEPEGIAVAAGGSEAGDVYVADASNRRVDEFSSGGAFIRAWGWGVEDGKLEFEICTAVCRQGQPHGEDGGGFEGPVGVAVDSASGEVYVSDPMTNGFELPIQKFKADGKSPETIGLPESLHPPGAAGTFNEPTALATDSSGDLYVLEVGNDRVQELDKTGNFVRLWGRGVHEGESGPGEKFGVCAAKCQPGEDGEAAGDFAFKAGSGEFNIAVDEAGNVWVPDSGDFRVQEFSSAGEFELGFGWGVLDKAEAFETCTPECLIGLKGAAPPQFQRPIGVAAAPSGCPIYVTDGGANELVDEFGACGSKEEPEQKPETKTESPPPNPNNGAGSSTGSSTSTGKASPDLIRVPTVAEREEKLASAFGLPSAKACYSHRTFKIHIQQPPGYPKIVSAEVFLGRHRERSLNKKGLTDRVVLTGLPHGTFTIKIVARTIAGTTLTGRRTYHTCRSKPIRTHRPPRL
jgi:DNA-binding beta-propeller fold protein YncE